MNPSGTAKILFKNTFFQLLAKFITMSVTLVATMILTRTYGREGYGDFNLMQNFPAIFFVIVDFGLNAIAVKEMSKSEKSESYWFNNIFWFRTLFSLVLIGVLWLGLYLFPYADSLRFGIQLGLFVILTQSFFNSASIIYQSKLRYDLASIGPIAGSLIIFMLVLLMSHFKVQISFVNFSYVIGGLVVLLVNYFAIRTLGIKFSFSMDPQFIKRLVIQSLPLGLMFIFSQINFKADSILLSILQVPEYLHLNNSEAVAVYGLPYKIFEVFLVLPTFYMNSLYPLLVQKFNTDKNGKDLYDFIVKNLLTLFLGGITIGSLGYLFSDTIVVILGGYQFVQSIEVAQILLGGIVLFFITQPLAWLLVLFDKQSYLPIIYLVSACFNVLCNYFFIPIGSFYASATITLISELLILLMLIPTVIIVWRKHYVA